MERATSVKPPYTLPPPLTPGRGLTAISTFSGCGGSSLGLRWAGITVRCALEFIPEAAATYQANHPATPVVQQDIRDVTGAHLLDAAGLRPGELDILEGSPPCAAFSRSGLRDKGWGEVKQYSDTSQRVDDLFFEWVRLASELQPRALIAENVAGLIEGKATGYLRLILKAIRASGFTPEARVLNAAQLGVPQARRRLIIIATRDDLARDGVTPAFPAPLPYSYAVRDAVVLPAKPRRTGPMLDPETGTDVAIHPKYVIGNEWFHLRQGQASHTFFNLLCDHPDRPAHTLTAQVGNVGAASCTHPTEPRKYTVAEARALCSFPPEYVLTGTYRQRMERLGRAVPPLMYKAVGDAVGEMLMGAAR